MDIFNIEPHIASITLEGKSFLIYGERKIGKTSIATKFPDAFIIGFEKGWNALNNVKAAPVKDWNHFKKDFVKPLLKDAEQVEKGKKDSTFYKTIIVDTGDIAYSMCEDYICSKEGVTHLDETENKRGYSMTEKEFENTMLSLMKANYTVIYISHADGKQVKDPITKEKEDKIIPTMNKRAFKVISRAVDMTTYCQTVLNNEGEPVRAMYFRTNGLFECGGRWGKYLPNAIPLDYDELHKAIIQAIEKQAEEDGVTPSTTNKSQHRIADESITYDYEALMSEIKRIGEYLHSIDKLEIMNDLSEEMLGAGQRVSQCTKMQVEVVHSFLNELKDRLEDKNIEIPDEE